ncbi:hypothetical protein [Marinobacter sp. P4B1]|uniref:hypothetical protein n=1 Tax=Marinobacter sp. P4B1 TaxID=1119533 RepID=UPI0011A90D38|nr:hypothetical protein [Marinobacter sp. P4B1]
MREYWGWFGTERFTRQDLWRRFEGQYRNAGGQEPWPKNDFLGWLKLSEHKWILPAPGPRGGEGWRLSDDLVEAFQTERKQSRELCCLAKNTIEHTQVGIGMLELDKDLYRPAKWNIVWSFKPPVPIPGPDVDGKPRNDPSWVFVFSVTADIEPEKLQSQVDGAASHLKLLLEKERCRVASTLEELDTLAAQIN